MDLKKEIKLSDLFKRGAKKDVADAPEAEETKSEPKRPARRLGKPTLPKLGRGGASAAPELAAVPLMRAFDLMPKDDPRQAEGGRRPSAAQLALAVVGLVLIAGLASFFLITNARVADKQREHDDLRAQLAARNVRAQEPAPAGDPTLVQERDQRRSALATALGSRVAWDRLLREFSLVLPEDVWLKSLKGTSAVSAGSAPPVDPNVQGPVTSAFEVSGYTRKQDSVAVLLSRLSVLPELESVQLVSATKTEIGDEDVVEFTIRANVKPPGAGGSA